MRTSRRVSKADQVYDIVRSRIVSMEMAPGARFVEREIAEMTGFGTTPIREALDRLSQEGLVKTMPRHGYQVRPITYKYVRDFFVVWRPLASLVIRLAAMNADEKQIKKLVEAAATKSDASSEGDWLKDSYPRVVEAADNEHLTLLWRRLSAVNERIFSLAFQHDPNLVQEVSASALLRALELHDPDKAAAAAEAFVDRCQRLVLDVLAKSEAPRIRVRRPQSELR